jgi:hypothetical protein
MLHLPSYLYSVRLFPCMTPNSISERGDHEWLHTGRYHHVLGIGSLSRDMRVLKCSMDMCASRPEVHMGLATPECVVHLVGASQLTGLL